MQRVFPSSKKIKDQSRFNLDSFVQPSLVRQTATSFSVFFVQTRRHRRHHHQCPVRVSVLSQQNVLHSPKYRADRKNVNKTKKNLRNHVFRFNVVVQNRVNICVVGSVSHGQSTQNFCGNVIVWKEK